METAGEAQYYLYLLRVFYLGQRIQRTEERLPGEKLTNSYMCYLTQMPSQGNDPKEWGNLEIFILCLTKRGNCEKVTKINGEAKGRGQLF